MKFLFMPKGKKGGGKESFEPRTEQSFSQYVMHIEFNESQIPVGIFSFTFPVCSILQIFVLKW